MTEWNDPNLEEWSGRAELNGAPDAYINDFHTYAMDWRPEGITFYVDGTKVAGTVESPQYRMCMILSMYINSDFSGWDGSENEYPIEWLIDYVRVYKDKNGYDETDRPAGFGRFIRKQCESISAFGQRIVSWFRDLFVSCRRFFERLFRRSAA